MELLKKKNSTPNKKRDIKRSNLLELVAGLLIIIFVNIIGHYLFVRLDLTAEKRYTLSKSTKEMLREVDETVLFRVYLEGEFPADFKRLQNETKEMLNQFRAYNKYIEYEFVNPNSFDDPKERTVFYQKLAKKGIQPTQIQVRSDNGFTQQVLIPAADVVYKGRETSIQLLQNQKYVSEEELLNNSIQDLEYVLSNAIRGLARGQRPRIGFLLGQGELERGNIFDIQMALVDLYTVENVTLDNNINALTDRVMNPKDSTLHFTNNYDVLVVAKPTQPFSERDLYLIDQFVMYGGKVMWLIDALDADLDSLATHSQAVATRRQLGLDEMLFTYGVRVNPDLIMDIRCRPIPMVVGYVGEKPQFDFKPWFYFPEIVPTAQHPIVRNLDLIKCDFASSIDLIDNDIAKTVLLTSSEYSRTKNAPVIVDLNDGKVDVSQLDQRLFNRSNLPIAVLLEGSFRSMWRNRLAPSFTELPEMGYREQSDTTQMIVIADGDIIKNRYNYEEQSGYPLGYDAYTQTMYANKEFLLNAINYLTGDEEMMSTRSRSIKLRKLDVMKSKQQRTLYQWTNLLLPLAMVAAAGVAITLTRKNRYKKRK